MAASGVRHIQLLSAILACACMPTCMWNQWAFVYVSCRRQLTVGFIDFQSPLASDKR